MSIPATELDTRFSDTGTEPTSWPSTVQVITDAQLFWISTVRADGAPHVTPLVAVWLDDALHFCTGGGEQKSLNLRSNPQVALTTGRSDWDRGLDVVVQGRAEKVTDSAQLLRLAEAWTGKWDGRWKFAVGDGAFGSGDNAADVYAVRPTLVLAFGKEPFTHTRHRF